MDVSKALQQLELAPTSSKSTGYNDLLSNIISSTSDPEDLTKALTVYVESLLGESLGIVASRPLLSNFVDRFASLPDPDVKIAVGQRLLGLLQPKVVSYEEQDTKVKLVLADAFEETEDWASSAKILQTVTLESQQRTITADDKASLWMRIVRCYIEEDDPTSASSTLNRVKGVLYEVQNKETKVLFQSMQARILDSQRQFLDASATYYAISSEPIVDEDDRRSSLSAAITCAVLAPAGPKRGMMLARIYKDERAHEVEEFSILEKIFLDRLLSPSEVKAFAAKLSPHQLAKTADGSTVLDKAILEHNLLGASKLYSNIGIDRLGVLLGVDADRAEQYAAQMIEQGRLAGNIDQIDRIIFFEGETVSANGVGKQEGQSSAAKKVGRALRKWDANVQALAEEVERVTTMIQKQHPDFYAANMVH